MFFSQIDDAVRQTQRHFWMLVKERGCDRDDVR
jgi:hypothetical protein